MSSAFLVNSQPTLSLFYSVEWNGGMEQLNGTVEWNSGMERWNNGMPRPLIILRLRCYRARVGRRV